ncbi:hypothetical protein EW146_g26 [Bondarzewia mesenterica]|uniref:F-box domain-containing protein n=1 Tax=Bondarzewia mesenterica TaxID=1095465 RepID=A0A4S4MA19_9AGAM|nr:hypothetical protein EW146_g26 [Bondarzewia mesenterica]
MSDYLNQWELLHLTFSYLDKPSNARNARVCKAWTDPALSHVWCVMESEEIARALQMLLNMCKTVIGSTKKYSLDFQRPLCRQDWDCLLPNFGRIQTISSLLVVKPVLELSRDAVHEIAATRPEIVIFPRLQCLEGDIREWHMDPCFMQSSVTNLTLGLSQANLRDISCMTYHVVDRMPLIRHIRIRASELPQSGFVIEICRLVGVACLSRLKHLHTVSLNNYGTTVILRSSLLPPGPFAPAIEPHAFPSLKALAIAASLEELTSIYVHATFPLSREPGYLRDFLKTTSIACTSLDDVFISLGPHGDIDRENAKRVRSLEFGDIAPLLDFQRLTSFNIRDAHPIRITDEEVNELASRLPSIQKLRLTVNPSFMSPPSLSLRALLPFAQHCGELTELGLCISCDLTASLKLPRSDVSFRKLSFLDLSASQISTSRSLRLNSALFLSRLVRKGTRIKTMYTPRPHDPHWIDARHDRTYQKRMQEVSRMVPLLIEVRKEDLEEVDALRRENGHLKSLLASR